MIVEGEYRQEGDFDDQGFCDDFYIASQRADTMGSWTSFQ